MLCGTGGGGVGAIVKKPIVLIDTIRWSYEAGINKLGLLAVTKITGYETGNWVWINLKGVRRTGRTSIRNCCGN